MAFATIDTLVVNGHSQKAEFFKNTQPLLISLRPLADISNTCITKTISNYLFHPEKIPLALQQRQHYKNNASRSFYVKNRKMLETNYKIQRSENSTSSQMIPDELKNILKTKPTVIKQNKLQQFYINREGLKSSSQFQLAQQQHFKSNLFKPNFPQKKRGRRNSMNLYKSIRPAEVYQNGNIRISKNKSMAFNQKDDQSQSVLRQRILHEYNSVGRTAQQKQQSGQNPVWKYKLQKQVKNIYELKAEFEVQPWTHLQNEDSYF